MSRSLFESFRLGNLTLSNRLVMAPMTRCRAADGNVPGPFAQTYYAQRASAGLIVTEGTPVSPRGHGYLWTPGIYTPPQISGWRPVTQAVHAAEGHIFCQIWHVGRVSHTSLQPDQAAPLAPTAIAASGAQSFAYDASGQPGYVATSTPRAMDADDIAAVIDEFAQAAENAINAGFDGVEIHAANGYLLEQFLNAQVNTRDDRYGGADATSRCRLTLDVLDACGGRIGAARVGVRISPNGRFNGMPEDPEMMPTYLHLATELERRGIAYLHVNDQRTFGLPALPETVTTALREAFSGPMILCGGYDHARATAAVEQGTADLIGFGMPYIANPDLVARLQHGWPLAEVRQATIYGGGSEGYTDYPPYQA